MYSTLYFFAPWFAYFIFYFAADLYYDCIFVFCGSDFHDLVKLKLKSRANTNATTTTTVAAIIHINKKSTNLKNVLWHG